MKKNLSLALLTALMAIAIIPASSFAATTGSSTATISIGTTDDWSLAINGSFATPAFAPTQLAANQTATWTPSGGAGITVVDNRSSATNNTTGHYVAFEFNDTTFTYTGTGSNGKGQDLATGNVLTLTSGTSPSDDQIYFNISSGNGTASAASYTAANSGCTVTASTNNDDREGYTTGIKASEVDFLESTTICKGTFFYPAVALKITGPADGFGAGSYSQTATLTLYDGVTSSF